MKPFRSKNILSSWQYMAWLVFTQYLMALLPAAEGQQRVEAIFNQAGVRGKIDFYQESSSGPTRITVNLTGLPAAVATFPWYIHQYPIPLDAQLDPCGTANTGGVYNPSNGGAVGNLSDRYGALNNTGFLEISDDMISLDGIYSIVGRSVVVFRSSSPLLCTNIDYPASSSTMDLLYVPFRGGFVGNVYFRQYGTSTASVYTDLSSLELTNSVGHNWHVHNVSLGTNRSDCMAAGPHYNPRNADVSSQFYADFCNPQNQSNCEVGDLSNKGAPLDVVGGVVRQFYTDTDLTLAGANIFIIGRSVVIHQANRTGPRIACANISVFYPLEAEAVFSSSVSGRISFSQPSPFDATRVTVVLRGLNGMANGYHVHVNPVGPASLGFPSRCGNDYTGGHWNPLNANYTAQPPSTSDQYEVGDLSGKFGGLSGLNMINETYWDPNIPLYGTFGIIGRSIVIHMDDNSGTRWFCADIVHTRPVATFSYVVNTTSVEGSITMTQFIDDPYSPTTIVVTLTVKVPLQPPALLSSSTPALSSSVTPIVSMSSTPVVSSSSIPMVSSSPTPMAFLSSTLVVAPSSTTMVSSSTPMVVSPSSTPMVSSSSTVPFSSATPITSTPSLTSGIFTSSLVSGMSSEASSFVTSMALSSSPTPTPTPAESSPSASESSSVSASSVVVASTPMMSSSSALSSSPMSVSPMPSSSSIAMPMMPSSSSVTMPMMPSSSVAMPTMPSSSSVAMPMIPSSTSPSTMATSMLPPSSSSDILQQSVATTAGSSSQDAISSTVTVQVSTEVAVSLDSSTSVTPTPSMNTLRRKRSVLSREKRQVARGGTFPFEWSLRSSSGGGVTDPADCVNLPVAGDVPPNPSLCSRNLPLACSAGDLTAKHGTLNLPLDRGSMLRVVFTDSNLPLTGPSSPFSPTSPPVLLVQPVGIGGQMTDADCAPAVYEPPPTSLPTSPAMPPTSLAETGGTASAPAPGSSPLGPIIGGVVAALVVAVVVIVLIIVLYCVCKGRRSKYEVSKSAEVEMGIKVPSKPVLGVPNYRVLHLYEPQNEGDLALQPGDWVTLEETPYGGGWWRGTVDDRSGWFPKTYVEYVDREAERKKKQEESFTMAAAVILDASSSFGSHHPSVSVKRGKSDASSERVNKKRKGKEAQRRHTFSRKEIDSTPKMVTKFDKPYLERDDIAAMVIENATKDGSLSGGSRPDTPKSIRNNEIIANTQTEDSENSQPDSDDVELTKAMLEGGDLTEDVVVHAEKYSAKYDFSGTSDIELDFTSGSVILVIEKSDNGWWRGIHKGQLGWFPESYMNPESLGKADLISKISEQEDRNKAADTARARSDSAGNEVERPKNMDETMASGEGDLDASEYRAIFTFQSEADGDLVFNEGDTVWVYWAQDNGWWFGSAGGLQGWFPESYVEPIIDTSSVPPEADNTSPAPSAQEEKAANEESKPEEESSLSSQLQAAMNKMKERSKSPSPAAPEGNVAVGETERDVTTGQDGPMVELAKAIANRKSALDNKNISTATSPVEESKATGESTTSVEDQSKEKTEHTVEGITKDVQDTPKDAPTDKAANGEALEENPVPDKPTSPVEDKELLLPKEPVEKHPKPAVRGERHPPPSGRSRRRPPPPPGTTSPTRTVPSVPEEKPLDVSQSPIISSRKSDTAPLLTPRKDSKTKPPKPTSPTRAMPPSIAEQPEPGSPVLSQSPALSSRKSDTAPLLQGTAVGNKNTKPGIAKASTMAKPRQTVSESQNVVKHKPQRRTTAIDNRTKPRRRPPPPVPAALLQAQGAPANSPKSPGDSKQAPLHAEVTPTSTPIPPPRAKARMKKVKRPTGRMIPPPPNIPLPLPPSVKKTSTPVAATKAAHPLATSTKVPPGEQTTPPVSPTAITASEKPASIPPRLNMEGAFTPKGTPKGPRPPPPKRISSLLTAIPPQVADKNERKPGGGLQHIQESKQETVTVKATASASSLKTDDSKVPPQRPPPPRPSNLPSNRRSSPPTTEPPALPGQLQSDASVAAEGGAHIAPRGSSLMGSLKRMVKRDSKKSPKAIRKDSQTKPERPAQLPQKKVSVDQTQGQPHAHVEKIVEPVAAQPKPDETDNSPVPKPRTKKSMKSDTSASDVPIAPSKATTNVNQGSPRRPTQPPVVTPQAPQLSSDSDAPPKGSESEKLVTPPAEKGISDVKPADLPSSPTSREKSPENASTASSPLKTQPIRTDLGTNLNSSPKPQAPKRTARTSTTSNTSAGNASISDPRTSVVSSSVETPSPASSEKRRSTNIPAKPAPPLSNIPAKPAPPLSPTKPALKPKPPIAPKPSTPSPHAATSTESFLMPSTSPTPKVATSEPVDTRPSAQDTAPSPSEEDSPPVNFYRTIEAYEAKSSEELSLAEGDSVMFIEKKRKGFYYGMKDDGSTGLFPISHVKPFLK